METREVFKRGELSIMFKSYYVVWKLSTIQLLPLFSLGLNRTMQYGNDDEAEEAKSYKLFKSYYVVWKPRMEKLNVLIYTKV